MATVRLTGHDEKTGALELLRLFFGSARITDDGDLQGGGARPLISSRFTVLPEGGCQVETRVLADWTDPSAGRSGTRPEPLVRREIKRQLYDLLSSLTGLRFPYGSLTGIRPTRLAAEQLALGRSPEATAGYLENEYGVSAEKARLLVATARQERALLATLPADRPLLYVHIPFCPTRCSYCSFTCETAGGRKVDLEAYVDALLREARRLGPHFRQPPAAVYIGGGTPTVLSAKQLTRLLTGLCSSIPLAGDTEFTVEAGRADTVDAEKLAVIAAAGARRVCVNPQTLQDQTLTRIGRNHSRADWIRAFREARDAGFTVINCDLIAGLPGEQPTDFAQSLAALVETRPENITIHTLAYKRKAELTRIARQREASETGGPTHAAEAPVTAAVNGPVTAAATDESTRAADDRATAAAGWSDALDQAHRLLTVSGYQPYYLYRQKDMVGGLENTGYALPGTACRYNVGMMSDERAVVGIGAGAMSKYIDSEGWLRRLPAPRDLSTWLAGLEAAIDVKIRLLFGP